MPENVTETELKIHEIHTPDDMPDWIDRDSLARFFHESLKPYEDPVEDIKRAMAYVFEEDGGQGGFLLVGEIDRKPVGALLMAHTGMKGYIPEDILVFICVDPSQRGKGLGGKIVRHALDMCPGDVKLHVEYDNPAKRLYERIGFTSKYAEMRYTR